MHIMWRLSQRHFLPLEIEKWIKKKIGHHLRNGTRELKTEACLDIRMGNTKINLPVFIGTNGKKDRFLANKKSINNLFGVCDSTLNEVIGNA